MNILAEADVLRYVTFECMAFSEDHLMDIRTDLKALKSKVGMLLVNGGAAGWGPECRLGDMLVSAGAGDLIEFAVPRGVTEGGVCLVPFDRVQGVLSTIESKVQGFMVCRFSVAARMFLQRMMNIRVRIPEGGGAGVWEISDDDRRALREVRDTVRNRLSMSLRCPRVIPVPSASGISMTVWIVNARDYSRAGCREDAVRLMAAVPSPSGRLDARDGVNSVGGGADSAGSGGSAGSAGSVGSGEEGTSGASGIYTISTAPIAPSVSVSSDAACEYIRPAPFPLEGLSAAGPSGLPGLPGSSGSSASPVPQATAGDSAGAGIRMGIDSYTIDGIADSLFVDHRHAFPDGDIWHGFNDGEAVKVSLVRGGSPRPGPDGRSRPVDSVVFDKEVFEDVVDAAVRYLPSVYLPPVLKAQGRP